MAELLTCRGAMAELLLARELQRSTIGKMLLAGAAWRMLLTRAAGENSWRKQLAETAGGNSKPAIAI